MKRALSLLFGSLAIVAISASPTQAARSDVRLVMPDCGDVFYSHQSCVSYDEGAWRLFTDAKSVRVKHLSSKTSKGMVFHKVVLSR